MHDWTLSAALMAKVLAEKGYHYQYLFVRNAKHVDRPTVAQTLPAALEWLWKGYPIPARGFSDNSFRLSSPALCAIAHGRGGDPVFQRRQR